MQRGVFYTTYVGDGGSAKLHDEEHVRELWCKSEIKKQRRKHFTPRDIRNAIGGD
jgi:hypothetical protein